MTEEIKNTNEPTEVENQVIENVENQAEMLETVETAVAETEVVAANPHEPIKTQTVSNIEPPEFDWSMDDQGFSNYSQSEVDNLKTLYEDTLSEIIENQLVKGQIVAITDKDVVLNVGFKSDGLIAKTEFRDMPDLKVGDTVEVMIEEKEDK